MQKITEINQCRICDSKDLNLVIDLGSSPVSSYFPLKNEPDPYSAPVTLMICENCQLIQLKHSTDINFLFGNTYGYRTSLNPIMKSHVESIADWLKIRADLDPKSAVLDIGSNDGTFLNRLGSQILVRIGIDPNCREMEEFYERDIRIIPEFFSAKFVSGLSFKLITSIAMFYDLEDPISFAKEIKSVLAKDGFWFLEQSYVLDMLENNSFDTLCHEHLLYYSLTSLKFIMNAADLEIVEIKRSTANGGSMGILVTHKNQIQPKNDISDIITNEKIVLNQLVNRFKIQVPLIKELLKNYLYEIKLGGANIWGLGASTKGNTILNYLDLNYEIISGISDKNPLKLGRVTPGTRIPIYSSEDLFKSDANYAMVLPWHFRQFIIKDEIDFLKRTGSLIFPLPIPEIVRENSISAIKEISNNSN